MFHEIVITRKAPRRIHGSDRRSTVEVTSGLAVFGLWSFESHENVITRKAQRRIHVGDRRLTVEVIIRVSPALSDTAGIAMTTMQAWHGLLIVSCVRGVQ